MKNSTVYIMPGIMTLDDIVCNVWEITKFELLGRCRKREAVDARKFAMWYQKKNSGKSLSKIGMEYGNKDHATVFYSTRKADDLMETDKRFRQKCTEAIERIEKSKIKT